MKNLTDPDPEQLKNLQLIKENEKNVLVAQCPKSLWINYHFKILFLSINF